MERELKMVITPNPPHVPFPPAATTMSDAFTSTAYSLPRVRITAPKITQPGGPAYFHIEYLLPPSLRVNDVLEFYLVDTSISFPVLIATYVLDDYSIFLALRRQQGVFIRGEKDVKDLIKRGITPGTYDLECIQYGVPTPAPPSPFPPGPQTPLRTVSVSFLNTYVIT